MGAVATVVPLLTGRLLGVSSVVASLFQKREPDAVPLSELEAALLAETEAEFGPSSMAAEADERDRLEELRGEAERSRPLFLVGLVLGAALASIAFGHFAPGFSLGASFERRYGSYGPLPWLVLLGSGVLIGLGTRVAGGCTSGHGISGVARGARGSVLTTGVFWATAVAVAWIFAGLGVR